MSGGRYSEQRGVPLVTCWCGTARQVLDMSRADYEAQYRGEYHASDSRHDGCTPYALRYEHDRRVAAVRWQRYRQVLGPRVDAVRRSLDVGCSTGAFVDHCLSLGIDAFGLDPDPSMARDRVTTSTIEEAESANRAGLLTMHDVLEHLVDPAMALLCATRLTAHGGVLIVDVPDVWRGAGDHHFKREHLWYFQEDSLASLAVDAGLKVIAFDVPIPGKQVIYCERP